MLLEREGLGNFRFFQPVSTSYKRT